MEWESLSEHFQMLAESPRPAVNDWGWGGVTGSQDILCAQGILGWAGEGDQGVQHRLWLWI